MAEFNARFYKVRKCGYYPYSASSDREIGGFPFLLEQLLAWSQNKTLERSRLPGSSEELPTYLLNIARHGSCWVIALWNEVPSSDSTVASVSRTSRVGQPQIHGNPIAAGSIPGFPTYFLCLPNHDLVATLKHEDRVTGLSGFKNYLSTFQEMGTSIADVEFDRDDLSRYEVRGYRLTDGQVKSLHPRFELQLLRSGTQRAAILSKHAQIRKVIRVKEMDPTSRIDRTLYQRGLAWLGLTNKPIAERFRVRQEFDVELSQEEVATVIDGVGDDLEREKNDVGFLVRGEASTIWLSGSILGHQIRVDAVQEDGVFDAANLAELINRRRNAILAAASP